MRLPEALKLTYEDYAALPEDRRYEVVDGDLFAMPSQTLFHQTVLLRLIHLLGDFVEQRDLGVVLPGPIDVLLSRYDIFQPDALFVSKARRPILSERCVAGPPDLIIEVLLPESEIHDRVDKVVRYAAFGVREMWLIDLEARTLEILVSTGEGPRREALYGQTETARSTVLPGLEITLGPVFEPIHTGLATIDIQRPEVVARVSGMNVPVALKFTYEDYCLLPEGQRYEVVDGEPAVTPAPTLFHQQVKGRLKHLLDGVVEAGDLGVVFDAPTDVVLSEFDILQPDIFVVLRERRAILKDQYVAGAPDLIVEVLSPSTEARDRTVKAKRYATFGVREMWLVDPVGKTIEVLINTPEGFRREALYGEADMARSAILPGLEFPVAPVFRPI